MKDSCAVVLRFLRSRGAEGATEEEIQAATGIRSGAQRVHELKRDYGYAIPKVMERSPMGAEYARWTLVEDRRPVFAGRPLGTPRVCPSCHTPHEAGRTCAWEPATA